MDRGESPAFAALTNASRRVFAAIEKAIGDGSDASVSYVDFRLNYHIGRKSVSPALKQLSALGLLDIQPGPRLVNIFRFSNRWRTIDAVEAVRKYNAAARSDIPAQKRSAAAKQMVPNSPDKHVSRCAPAPGVQDGAVVLHRR
jgi:hypothetical protein